MRINARPRTASNTTITMFTMKPMAWLFIVTIVSSCFIVLASSVRPSAQAPLQAPPSRIISLIPAVTEMLFAVGAGPQVVAVSSFDEYPPEVKALPRVGALLDPDLERILSLRPDLVVVYATQTDLRRQLERATIPQFVYSHAALADISTTIRQLGTRVGREREAIAVVNGIGAHLTSIRKRVAGRQRPKTMLVFGRDALALRGIYASGGVGFLNDMLVAAGGENIFGDVRQQSVQATSELILTRRPEAIVQLRSEPMGADEMKKEIAVWQGFSSVPAVRANRVMIVADPRTMVPGPRVAEATELLARALHPDAFK